GPDVSTQLVHRVAQTLGAGTISVIQTSDRFIARNGVYRLEVYKKSGGIWLEDTTALWVPDLHPSLPNPNSLSHDPGNYLGIAMTFTPVLAVHGVQPDSSAFRFAFTGAGRSGVTTLNRTTGVRTHQILDTQLNFAAFVSDSQSGHRSTYLPTVGGGGTFKVVYGDGGKVIGMNGVWRRIIGIERRARMVSRQTADQTYLQRMRSSLVDTVESFDATLAYYSVPAPYAQTRLVPVYVYRGHGRIDGRSVTLMPLY